MPKYLAKNVKLGGWKNVGAYIIKGSYIGKFKKNILKSRISPQKGLLEKNTIIIRV